MDANVVSVWVLALRPKNGSVAAGRRLVHDRSLFWGVGLNELARHRRCV
jgi:hypothetical protein